MKNLLVAAFALTLAGMVTVTLRAQSPESGNREKMRPFAGWVGHWTGEGTMQMGPGEPKRSRVDERIESRLDGLLLVVEGIGKSTDPSTNQETVVHHAFAVLSYDPQAGDYKFKTFLKDGRSADAWLRVLGDNKYQWGFDTSRGKTRYNITLDPEKKTWNETGEYSADGNSWMKFFEMNLTRAE